jgi:hypothetical protein
VPLSGQSPRIAMCECRISVPAGSDTADAASLQAMLSAFIGFLDDVSSGLGETLSDGVL